MYERMEDEHESAKIFSTTRELLGWTRAGPPTQFLQDGNIVKTQKEVANLQAEFYKKQNKTNKKHTSQGGDRSPKIFKKSLQTMAATWRDATISIEKHNNQ